MGKVGSLRRLSRVALLVGVAAALVGVPLAASANPDVSGFELDGNAASSGAADWNALGSPARLHGRHRRRDRRHRHRVRIGRATKDTNDVSQWKWAEDDVTPEQGRHRQRVRLRVRGAEQPRPLLRADAPPRQDRRRERRLLVPPERGRSEWRTGSFSGSHVDGDILVQSEFTNGGGVSGVHIYKWQGGVAHPRSIEPGRVRRRQARHRRTRAPSSTRRRSRPRGPATSRRRTSSKAGST